jgi:hypothetical protein
VGSPASVARALRLAAGGTVTRLPPDALPFAAAGPVAVPDIDPGAGAGAGAGTGEDDSSGSGSGDDDADGGAASAPAAAGEDGAVVAGSQPRHRRRLTQVIADSVAAATVAAAAADAAALDAAAAASAAATAFAPSLAYSSSASSSSASSSSSSSAAVAVIAAAGARSHVHDNSNVHGSRAGSRLAGPAVSSGGGSSWAAHAARLSATAAAAVAHAQASSRLSTGLPIAALAPVPAESSLFTPGDPEEDALYTQPLAYTQPPARVPVAAGPAQLGLQISATSANAVMVARALPGYPAHDAGVRDFDMIVAVGDAATYSARAFDAALAAIEPGQRVPILLRRGGQSLVVLATAGRRDVAGEEMEQHVWWSDERYLATGELVALLTVWDTALADFAADVLTPGEREDPLMGGVVAAEPAGPALRALYAHLTALAEDPLLADGLGTKPGSFAEMTAQAYPQPRLRQRDVGVAPYAHLHLAATPEVTQTRGLSPVMSMSALTAAVPILGSAAVAAASGALMGFRGSGGGGSGGSGSGGGSSKATSPSHGGGGGGARTSSPSASPRVTYTGGAILLGSGSGSGGAVSGGQ